MKPARSPSHQHAVVIGASMTGLLTARVLADYYDKVTILEQDKLSDSPMSRRGVPQAAHIHVLLAKGCELLERFFPGLTQELKEQGAMEFDFGERAYINFHGTQIPRFNTGIRTMACSRALLEWGVRRQLRSLPQVQIKEEIYVSGLEAEGAHLVRGLRVRGPSDTEEAVIEADLVVDASGRGSHAPKWLEAIGLGPTPETTVKAGLGYSTRWYRVPAERQEARAGDWVAIGMATQFPHRPNSGSISRVENEQMLVTLIGTGNQFPPDDELGFMEFARGISDPIVYDVIRNAEPISPIHKFRGGINRRRHFDKVKGWPQGFVVLGDAACVLNPVYGQGMTLAAMSAELLAQCLAEGSRCDRALECHAFQKRLARMQFVPWLMAVAEDALWQAGPNASMAQRLNYRLQQRLVSGLLSTQAGALRFLHVMHMLHSPLTLLSPVTLLHAARGLMGQRASGRAPAQAHPLPA